MLQRFFNAVTGDLAVIAHTTFVCLSAFCIISCTKINNAISSATPIMAIDETVLLESLQEHLRERARNSVPKPQPLIGVAVWQLYNHCSNGFLQSFFKNVNARGELSNDCLLNFVVQIDSNGAILLKHVLSQKYICFNRRKRITTRDDPHDHKCRFYEHITKNGYTQLESAWFPGIYLGFNRKGRFQDPTKYFEKRKCFFYTKMEKFITDSEFRRCVEPISSDNDSSPPRSTEIAHLPHSESQRMLYELSRDSLLQRIQA
uniref:Fibroblast growth factor 17 n=1 Tax=Acrobeloides nanus TaxID=290746 RepID=A0A914EE91_9BILA